MPCVSGLRSFLFAKNAKNYSNFRTKCDRRPGQIDIWPGLQFIDFERRGWFSLG